MTPENILKWAEVGAVLINQLGVPIASMIRMFREVGGTEEELLDLIYKWASLHTSVVDRIAFLKAAISVMEEP